jgi:LysR family glycine cleavage system transcriptional activator
MSLVSVRLQCGGLIPRLLKFSDKYPRYDVRLSTDDRHVRRPVDVEIIVVSSNETMVNDSGLLFKERLGLVFANPLSAEVLDKRLFAATLPRLETRTRPNVWTEWTQLVGHERRKWSQPAKVFDHYHLTIEAALSGMGAAIVPWHLVADEVKRARLIAPWGFRFSECIYVARAGQQGKRKNREFIDWLREETAGLRAEEFYDEISADAEA